MRAPSLVFLALALAQASLGRRILFARQQTIDPGDIPPACSDTCTPAVNTANSCTQDSCICTDSFASQYDSCIDCILNIGGPPSAAVQQEFQGMLDQITQECAAEGFPISSLTISLSAAPTGGSTATGASQPAGSGSSTGAPAPSGSSDSGASRNSAAPLAVGGVLLSAVAGVLASVLVLAL